jgi:hypothetical protein
MAQPSRQEGDWTFAGIVRFLTSIVLPSSCVANAQVSASAAIATSKMLHLHRIPFHQPNTTATAETRVVYVCVGATGTILNFKAGSIAIAIGAATVTLDLKKNGTTVLSGVITLDSSNVARVVEAGTLSVTALVAGDVLEIVTTATAGGGTIPTGLFAEVTVEEDAQ